MSTRAQIVFVDSDTKPKVIDGRIEGSMIYHHSDGYPEWLGVRILEFLKIIRDEVGDTRFTDAEFLAARFLFHMVMERQKALQKFHEETQLSTRHFEGNHPLDFLGIGICDGHLHGDVEYVYIVHCGTETDAKVPRVSCYHVGWDANALGDPVDLNEQIVQVFGNL